MIQQNKNISKFNVYISFFNRIEKEILLFAAA